MKLYFATEFSSYPDGMDEGEGEFNATSFRKLLAAKFQQAREKSEPLEVILDDVHGLTGSFLDASFGIFAKELKKQENFQLSEDNLVIKGNLPHYEIYAGKAWECITNAIAEVAVN